MCHFAEFEFCTFIVTTLQFWSEILQTSMQHCAEKLQTRKQPHAELLQTSIRQNFSKDFIFC